MTTYSIVYKENEALVLVTGHAGYADEGFDIVCASISTACILSANLIEHLKLGYNIIDVQSEKGYFKLQVKTDNEIVLGIIQNLECHLDELQKQNPTNLKKKK